VGSLLCGDLEAELAETLGLGLDAKLPGRRAKTRCGLFFWGRRTMLSSPQETPNRSNQRRRICPRPLDPNRKFKILLR
jgi:hypothetical protein